jgi:hypothetical protein
MTAAASWLIICALFIFAAPYLPRIAARVQAEQAERWWEAQLRADLLPLDAVPEEGDAPLYDADYADMAAREAARIETEWWLESGGGA